MAAESSVFLTQEPRRRTVDCSPSPDVAIYYDGVTTAVPVLEAGNIVFRGAKTSHPAGGVADAGAIDAFSVPFATILAGGAGARVRGCVTATKQKYRLFCQAAGGACARVDAPIGLQLAPVETCEDTYVYNDERPLMVFADPACVVTCCEALNQLAREFNIEYAHLGTAAVVQIGAEYALEIETLKEGQRFRFITVNGLTAPQLVVPGRKPTYTNKAIKGWFGPEAVSAECDTTPEACIPVVEIFHEKQYDGSPVGALTSNMGQTNFTKETVTRSISCLFASNTNGNAAKAALITILNGGGNAYLDKLVTEEVFDKNLYPYTLIRTDAGTLAAYNTVKTQYTAALMVATAARDAVAGKTYYTFYTNSATAPAIIAESGDVIKVGVANIPNIPFANPCA